MAQSTNGYYIAMKMNRMGVKCPYIIMIQGQQHGKMKEKDTPVDVGTSNIPIKDTVVMMTFGESISTHTCKNGMRNKDIICILLFDDQCRRTNSKNFCEEGCAL